jgi:hypothetical protein
MAPILPLAYFGNLEYFWYFTKHTKVCIDVNEIYLKQTYRNRAEIYGANGRLNLSIPVVRPHGAKTRTDQITISEAENWQKNHWKSIESAYRRTPFYEFYADQIEIILFEEHDSLMALNLKLTQHLINKLGIDCEIEILKKSPQIIDNDLRTTLSPKKESHFKSSNYIQTFNDRNPFMANLSILDLLFNEGPNAICILEASLKHLKA